MNSQNVVRRITRTAIIAAMYVVLCYVLAPLSYGPVQVRFSEALTLLVVLCPEAIIGVTLGCFLSNLLSFSAIDLVVGTLATLLAALATCKLRSHRIGKKGSNPGFALLASVPPVLFNAVIIGAEISLVFAPGAGLAGFIANMVSVGIGQLISCSILGVLLVWVIEKNPALLRLFNNNGIAAYSK